MRNTLPLLSKPTNAATALHDFQPTAVQQVPSIRLISATPSAAGMSSDASTSLSNSFESSWASVNSHALAPKPDSQPRKRLVPKKSKLGLLGVGPKDKEKDRGKDLSDVIRRVGAGTSSSRGGFDIYVDPTNDPELGDILVVKKQKSRAALSGMTWGALEEVTNIPNVPRNVPISSAMLKVKEEEKKWWSIGRGRKDSKEKGKEGKENPKRTKSPHAPVRSKTPEPFNTNQEGRARSNSLDTGVLLNMSKTPNVPRVGSSAASDPPHVVLSRPSAQQQQSQRSFTPDSLKEACRAGSPAPAPSRAGTPAPTLNGFLAPPNATAKDQGSIALRAIRSVRSLARMGSWAQMTGVNENGAKDGTVKEKKERKGKKGKKERKENQDQNTVKEKKVKKVKKVKEEGGTVRLSTSSFEAGALTASPEPLSKQTSQTLGKKKHSILGLGLGFPSSMRLPTARNGSVASSVLPQPNRLSVEGVGTRAKERMGSTMSTASSLRPLSTASSSGTSACTRESRGSIKWDEEGLQSGKREIQKEKKEKKKREKAKEEKESKRSLEGRRRISISQVFPEVVSNQGHGEINEEQEEMQRRYSTAFPIVTIEEATADGHGTVDDTEEIHDSMVYGGILREEEKVEVTPVKRQRVRPMSEQLLGRSRPRAMHEDEEGVLSILDAATNDLAQLINNLDLEATPATPDLTPLRPSPLPANILDLARLDIDPNGSASRKALQILGHESPLKNKSPPNTNHIPTNRGLTLRNSAASITSLRPYAQSRGSATRTLTTPVFATSPTKAGVIGRKTSDAGIGQQIAPWPVLLQQVSPLKESKATKEREKENAAPKDTPSGTGTWKKGHKRTMTPGPEPEPAPVFQPLKPPKTRTIKTPDSWDGMATLKSTASAFFAPKNDASNTNATKGSVSPPASLGRRASAFLRKRCSLLPVPADVSLGDLSFSSSRSGSGSNSNNAASLANGATLSPVPVEKRRRRMPATLGGSDVSCYAVPELDASDPDSDIPDELQFILKANSDRGEDDDTFDFNKRQVESEEDSVEHPRSAALEASLALLPEMAPAPVLYLTGVGGDQGDIDDGEHGDVESDADADTKKSFDFTGELQRLNESGASDRRSFVEQLESAFRTPAKVDLRCDFGGLLRVEAPPVPSLPQDLSEISSKVSLDFSKMGSAEDSVERLSVPEKQQMEEQSDAVEMEEEPDAFDMFEMSRLIDVKEPTFFNAQSTKCEEESTEKDSESHFNLDSASRIADVKEPTDMFGSSLEVDSASGPGHIIVSADPSDALNASTSSRRSRLSDGELNTSFRFGGLPRSETEQPKQMEKPLTLSDIIPPLSHVRSLSSPGTPSSFEDDSLFNSILAKVTNVPAPQARARVASDASEKARKAAYRHSQASSIASFTGLDSFEEVRRGFEFNPNRPSFYPPPTSNNRRGNHYTQDSIFSIASVSSYGRVINPGIPDPFDFGLPSLQERPSSEDLSTTSFSIDDTFSFLNHASRRRRVDSDASSFSYHAPLPRVGHRRHESNMSVSSQAPPISLYNRSYAAHRRNDSSASASSRRPGHHYNNSADSILSDFSAMRLGRPGLGDKMFEMADQAMPLTSISASPPESASASISFSAQPSQYDSIIDDDRVSMDASDSIFDKTGHRTSMISDDSVFGYDDDSRIRPGLLPPHQFRPLSVISASSVHSPAQEDDTMISMLGGGHVRRRSIGSIMEASPCARVEKRKHGMFQGAKGDTERYESPNKARIVEKPSIASSFQFGAERMIKAQHGLLERQSLEDSCLVGAGEDMSFAFHPAPVFVRPVPGGRSRSSTCTSSSGGDTPPLSASDGASVSGSSMSSIDLSEIDMMLSNTTHPMSTLQNIRARGRSRGHRRRYSQVRTSRTNSVYETIEEELSSVPTSPAQSIATEKTNSPTQCQPVFIVDGDSASMYSNPEEPLSTWDDERGIVALRKYYALRDEAHNTVTESKRLWSDTPFSIFAVQSFQPPHHPEGMQALLTHSVQNYGPLPSELRPLRTRSRKDSRPSPYPPSRPAKVTISPEATRSTPVPHNIAPPRSFATPMLQQVLQSKLVNIPTAAPTLASIKPLSPFMLNIKPDGGHVDKSELKKDNTNRAMRPRVGSNARRTALGWTKRSTGPKGSTGPENNSITGGKLSTGASTVSTDQKENVVGMGSVMTPGDTLRINRPRPKGRPTPASTVRKAQRPIRV